MTWPLVTLELKSTYSFEIIIIVEPTMLTSQAQELLNSRQTLASLAFDR